MMELWPAIRLSLSFGFIATLINLIPAVALGFFLARKTFPGKSLVEGIVSLPLVIPPVSLGFLLLLLLGRNGLLGGIFTSVGISIAFTSLAGVIASAVVSFPLVVKNIRTAVEMTDRSLEEAASSLGAPPLSVFFRIILPQIWPGVLGGLVLGFTRALGEFGATMVFAGNIPGGNPEYSSGRLFCPPSARRRKHRNDTCGVFHHPVPSRTHLLQHPAKVRPKRPQSKTTAWSMPRPGGSGRLWRCL
jgi:molybdate transport system permease protein